MVSIALDKDTQRQMLAASQWYYFDLHQGELFEWVQDKFDQHSYIEAKNYFYDNPYIGYLILKQQEINNDKKEELIVNELLKPGKIHIVVGSKGSGKTCLSYYLTSKAAEKGKEVWFFGPPVDVPYFIKGTTLNFSKIPNDALTIIDEASVQFFNATSRSEKIDVIRLLPVIRHSNQSFIVITQNTAIMDINFLRMADSIIFKSPSILQSISEGKYERIRISETLSSIAPKKISNYLFYNDKYLLLPSYPLPLWWKESFSTPYAPFKSKYKAYLFIINSLEELDDYEIHTQLLLKKFNVDPYVVEYIRSLYEDNPNLASMVPGKLITLIEKGFNATSIQELMNHKEDTRILDFRLSPIQRIMDKEQSVISRKKINLFFLNELKYRKNMGANCIISITGYPGTGKSWGGLALAEILQKIYKNNSLYIVYSPSELLEKLKEAPKGSTFIMDEQTQRTGTGSETEKYEMNNAEQTMRKFLINFIWISAIPQSHLDMFSLTTYGINTENNKSRFLVNVKNHLLGHIILNKPSDSLLEKFNNLEDQFKEKVKLRKSNEKPYEEMAKEVLSNPEWQYAKNRMQKLLVIEKTFPHISQTMTQLVLAQAIMMESRALST